MNKDAIGMCFYIPPFLVQSSYERAICKQAFLVTTSSCAATTDARVNSTRENITNAAVEPCVNLRVGAGLDTQRVDSSQ